MRCFRAGSDAREVFTLEPVYFAASLINSTIVSTMVTASVLFFTSLAGFAFAKLRFKGRNALMVVVILTVTVPNQLGVVALFILMGKRNWNGTHLRGDLERLPVAADHLSGTEFPTSMVALSDLASGNYVIYRRVLAGAFAATVPLLVLPVIGGRQIVRGIMEGAVKS